MIGHTNHLSGRHFGGLVLPVIIIVHEMQGDRVGQVLNFLRKRIGQPRESSHRHSHREILTYDVLTCSLRLADDGLSSVAVALARAVLALGLLRIAVRPVELWLALRVIGIPLLI